MKDTLLKDATPRPWEAVPEEISTSHGRIAGRCPEIVDSGDALIAKAYRQNNAVGRDAEAEANAALVVQAVNAYEHHLEVIQELVSACDDLCAWLLAVKPGMGATNRAETIAQVESARAIIAKATEQ